MSDVENVEAMRLLARAASATALNEDGERLLRRAIALAPDFIVAYVDLSALLCRLGRADEAIAFLNEVAQRNPREVWPLSIKAAVLSAERRDEEAVQAHEAVTASAPEATVPWMNYAYALKTVGRTEEAIAAYRRSLQLDSANGSAWWGLANLRTIKLDAADAALMERALDDNRDSLQKVQLHFAIGRALNDIGEYERSFTQYEEANRLRGTLVPYDPALTRDLVRRSEAIFTHEFFAQREGQGCDAHEVVFIVGMPRSGSTLVEQVLASHPAVEGMGELFDLREIAIRISGQNANGTISSEAIAELSADQLRAIGEEYICSVQRRRRTDRPFFTDKMPSNWQLVPLIQLSLPNAKIVDVRRAPLSCCLSCFATYFNRETSFPASLQDLARYYRDYVRLMRHMDAVLPRRVHRVHYEHVVEDLEGEVRHLLAAVGLPFSPDCLSFFETERAIHTPSAQQVREPIYRSGLDHWKRYETWWAPVEDEIGPF